MPTTVASVDCLDLAALDVATLSEPRFRIGDAALSTVRPALLGSPDAPCLRLDPPSTRALPGDRRAASALASGPVPAALDAGDPPLPDDYRAVHGRGPSRPRHDGTDRWLRRRTTTRDPRPTRGGRSSADGRAVTPRVVP
ncbi:hypothetical protein [Streptomyces zhaozhouensis]|uniref:hypothetical protein n=1 Tax=Streptomyces zhaozhouensis TaxID=1300267 RepID=UPI00114320AF|nr:hypothetical protein [Streptomyces zhaozhouensis]